MEPRNEIVDHCEVERHDIKNKDDVDVGVDVANSVQQHSSHSSSSVELSSMSGSFLNNVETFLDSGIENNEDANNNDEFMEHGDFIISRSDSDDSLSFDSLHRQFIMSCSKLDEIIPARKAVDSIVPQIMFSLQNNDISNDEISSDFTSDPEDFF